MEYSTSYMEYVYSIGLTVSSKPSIFFPLQTDRAPDSPRQYTKRLREKHPCLTILQNDIHFKFVLTTALHAILKMIPKLGYLKKTHIHTQWHSSLLISVNKFTYLVNTEHLPCGKHALGSGLGSPSPCLKEASSLGLSITRAPKQRGCHHLTGVAEVRHQKGGSAKSNCKAYRIGSGIQGTLISSY